MKKIFFFTFSILPIAALLLLSCKSRNYIDKEDLIGVYKIDKAVPIDTTLKTAMLADKPVNWTLSLMEKDNFEFNGNGKTVMGYWAFAEKDGKKNWLLFNSGRIPERTVYAQFNKTELYFDKPNGMLDSVFQEVIFKRADK